MYNKPAKQRKHRIDIYKKKIKLKYVKMNNESIGIIYVIRTITYIVTDRVKLISNYLRYLADSWRVVGG
jgi:hypothetical protein